MVALGLTLGGYKLGQAKAGELPQAGNAQEALSSAHPLATALQLSDDAKLSQAQKEQLRKETALLAQRRAELQRLEMSLNAQRRNESQLLAQKKAAAQAQLRALEADLQKARGKANSKGSNEAALRAELARARARVFAEELNIQRVLSQKNPKSASAQKQVQIKLRDVDVVQGRIDNIILAHTDAKTRQRMLQTIRIKQTMDASQGFALLKALDERDVLDLTPAQVTKLQLLQAEFITRFAPIREEHDNRTLKLNERRIESAKAKTDPASNPMAAQSNPAPLRYRVELSYSIQRTPKEFQILTSWKDLDDQLKVLKEEIDSRAYEVLTPDQGKKLKRLVD